MMGYSASSAVGKLNCFPTTIGFHVACLWLPAPNTEMEKRHLESPTILLFVPCIPMHAVMKINAEANMVLQDFQNKEIFRVFQSTPNVVYITEFHDGCGY